MNASSLLGRRIDGVMFSPTGRLVGLLLDDGSGIAFDRAEVLEAEEVRQKLNRGTEKQRRHYEKEG
jgi:hypothetical protein